MESEQIRTHIRNASRVAIFLGVATIIATLGALVEGPDSLLDEYGDPWNLLDAVIWFALAWGIRTRSRTATVFATFYFLVGRIVYLADTGFQLPLFAFWLVLLYFFIRGIHAAFVYHGHQRATDPDYGSTPKLVYLVVAPAVAIGVTMTLWGLIMSWLQLTAVPPPEMDGWYEYNSGRMRARGGM